MKRPTVFSPDSARASRSAGDHRMAIVLVANEPNAGEAQLTWHVWRVPRAVNVGLPGGKTRIVAGWQYQSNDGVERFVEGTWLDLVARLRETALNYGYTARIS